MHASVLLAASTEAHVIDSSKPTNHNDDVPDGRREEPTQPNRFYKVLLTAADRSFELAEHRLSGQLLFIFRGLPDLELAGELEAMGFDHSDDERMFTVTFTAANRHKALKLAREFSCKRPGPGR